MVAVAGGARYSDRALRDVRDRELASQCGSRAHGAQCVPDGASWRGGHGHDTSPCARAAHEVEVLAEQYYKVLALGAVHLLPDDEMARVIEKLKAMARTPTPGVMLSRSPEQRRARVEAERNCRTRVSRTQPYLQGGRPMARGEKQSTTRTSRSQSQRGRQKSGEGRKSGRQRVALAASETPARKRSAPLSEKSRSPRSRSEGQSRSRGTTSPAAAGKSGMRGGSTRSQSARDTSVHEEATIVRSGGQRSPAARSKTGSSRSTASRSGSQRSRAQASAKKPGGARSRTSSRRT